MRLLRSVAALGTGAAALALVGCERPGVPAPGSPAHAEAVSHFYTGVAAVQVGEEVRAEGSLSRVLELAPGEPAAAANLAIVAFQQQRMEEAAEWIARARRGAPDHPDILILSALIDRARGALDPAIGHLERVIGVIDPASEGPARARARYLFSQLLEERAGPGDVTESRRLLDGLLEGGEMETFLLVISARHGVRHGDEGAVAGALERLAAVATGWPDPQREQLEWIREIAAQGGEIGAELTFLSARLEALPEFQEERDAIAISVEQPDLVVTALLRMESPSPRPPEPDLELDYASRPIDLPDASYLQVTPLWLGDGTTARILLRESDGVRIVGGVEELIELPALSTSLGIEGPPTVAPLDFDHDFLMDLALAGEEGLRLLRQQAPGEFVDLTSEAIPASARESSYLGVWALDVDVDGDMDLILARPGLSPLVLLNRGDGTFAEEELFGEEVGEIRQLAWGDLDGDGVPDAVVLDAEGGVHLLINPRQDRPRFTPEALPSRVDRAVAVAVADLDANGRPDLLVLRRNGELVRNSRRGEGWEQEVIAEWTEFDPERGDARLLVQDFDNNGALDVLATAGGHTHIWLADSDYRLIPWRELPLRVTGVGDLDGSGWIELLAIDEEGTPLRLTPRPTRDYFALTLYPRAAQEPGDRRVNTFGIGGEVEVRAGMLYQKQFIHAPAVHLGIGENTGVSVARIIWPNGMPQAEFDLLATQGGEPVIADQRLKGSCPWLFAHDGEEMRFVTDIIWRTALGLRINAQGGSAVIHSEDRVKIRGDQLRPRDGHYELSVTGELWESLFFDHIALKVVDHPAETEIFVDERFTLPPPSTEVRTTGPLHPLAGAWTDAGADVLEILAERDGRYVDDFELGEFQGVAREHVLEVDLGSDAPVDVPLLLVAHGWVYPTDGSINMALGQGEHDLPRGIQVEVPDGEGGWRVLHSDLGMPAGKTKNVLIDLEGAFREGMPRRVRLRTNMEIYWDQILWGEAHPSDDLRISRILPEEAELRFRGFSQVHQDGRRAPELPVYEIGGTAPQWRDLEGYYTRFGDVLPLLLEVDDRYVIMNAGDELVLRFPELPGPEPGWARSYILIADGWTKDGDFNNGFPTTLLPLPYHDLADYSTPPGVLEDDSVYQRFPEDWRTFHTRYVNPEPFVHALATH